MAKFSSRRVSIFLLIWFDTSHYLYVFCFEIICHIHPPQMAEDGANDSAPEEETIERISEAKVL